MVRTSGGSSTLRSFGRAAHRDGGDLELYAGAGGDVVAVALDQVHQRTAHVAASEDADTDVVHRLPVVFTHDRQR